MFGLDVAIVALKALSKGEGLRNRGNPFDIVVSNLKGEVVPDSLSILTPTPAQSIIIILMRFRKAKKLNGNALDGNPESNAAKLMRERRDPCGF